MTLPSAAQLNRSPSEIGPRFRVVSLDFSDDASVIEIVVRLSDAVTEPAVWLVTIPMPRWEAKAFLPDALRAVIRANLEEWAELHASDPGVAAWARPI